MAASVVVVVVIVGDGMLVHITSSIPRLILRLYKTRQMKVIIIDGSNDDDDDNGSYLLSFCLALRTKTAGRAF